MLYLDKEERESLVAVVVECKELQAYIFGDLADFIAL